MKYESGQGRVSVIGDYDQPMREKLEDIGIICRLSHPKAQEKIERVVDGFTSLWKRSSKSFEGFLDVFDQSDLSRDLIAFQMLYLTDSFRSVYDQNRWFGLEHHNILLANDYDLQLAGVFDHHLVTGWRGSGKSLISQHHALRMLCYRMRVNVGIMARTKTKASNILRSILDNYLHYTIDANGDKKKTAFSQRFGNQLPFADTGELDTTIRKLRQASTSHGFDLTNGVRVIPYGAASDGRGEAGFRLRTDALLWDDVETKGEALSEHTQKTWRALNTFFAANTGDPSHSLISFGSGNRVNPEEESVFNRFIVNAEKTSRYRYRSLPMYSRRRKESNTIRFSYEQCLEEEKKAECRAEVTDNPYDDTHSIFDMARMQTAPLNDARQVPSFRILFVDPAFSENNKSSKVGLCVAFNTVDRTYFGTIEKPVVPGMSFTAIVIQALNEYDINLCLIERGANASFIREQVQKEAEQYGIHSVVFDDLIMGRRKVVANSNRRGGSVFKQKHFRILDQIHLFDPERMIFIDELKEPVWSQLGTFSEQVAIEKVRGKKSSFKRWDALDAFAYGVEYIANMEDEQLLKRTLMGEAQGEEYIFPNYSSVDTSFSAAF